MTGADLKTLRESLGLPLQWVARQAGVRLRSVQYWEAGQRPVPRDVAHMLLKLDAQVRELVAAAVRNIKDTIADNGSVPERLALIRYRTDANLWHYHPGFKPLPTSCHGMMIAQIVREVEALGIPVGIVYMQPDKYKAWLGGRKDEDSLRSLWAEESSAH